jgi:hypothetical protein
MKKLLLLISIIISVIDSDAQTSPDFGFETWATTACPTIQDPTGWASFNLLNCFPFSMPQTVFKDAAAGLPTEGSFATKIVTDVIPSSVPPVPNPFGGGNMDTVGLLTVGTVQASSPYIYYGSAYTGRPASLTFACKYSPQAGDSAFVVAYLTKWNGVSKDTIARGKFATGTTTATYTLNTLMMNYNSAFNASRPDTMIVFASSSIYDHNGAKKGSTFYVDAFKWNGWVNTNDIDGIKNNVSIYPNPASNKISIKCSIAAKSVDVMDITGRKIGNYLMTNNEVSFETQTFSPGLYIYNVIDENAKVINKGKFEVAR